MSLVSRIFILSLALVFAASAPAGAVQAPQSATEFYHAYRMALAKAQKIDDLLPMMAASRRAEIAKTPTDDRQMMFEMVKEMTAEQGAIKIVKETATATGAELTVEAKSDVGTVTLVKEAGSWKVDKESWKNKM